MESAVSMSQCSSAVPQPTQPWPWPIRGRVGETALPALPQLSVAEGS